MCKYESVILNLTINSLFIFPYCQNQQDGHQLFSNKFIKDISVSHCLK